MAVAEDSSFGDLVPALDRPVRSLLHAPKIDPELPASICGSVDVITVGKITVESTDQRLVNNSCQLHSDTNAFAATPIVPYTDYSAITSHENGEDQWQVNQRSSLEMQQGSFES